MTGKFSCSGIISIKTQHFCVCFFFKSCLPLSSIVSETCQGTGKGGLLCFLALPALSPDGAQVRWLMLSLHLRILWEWQCSEHSSPGNWATRTRTGAESLCQITAESSDPLIFLSFCDTFRKSSAHAVYSLWAILSFFWANREAAFRFWWYGLKYQERKRIIYAYVISPNIQTVSYNKPSRNRKAELQTVCQEYMKACWKIIPSSILLQLLQEWIWVLNKRNVLS